MSAESMVVVVGDTEEILLLSTIPQYDVLYLSNSRSVFDNLVLTQDDFTAKIVTIPVTRWVNSTIVDLLPVAIRESSTISFVSWVGQIKESRGGILEKVAELYRLYRKPHRPTSDTQDEGTADVGWQSLLQSTARQGDDVVYMEFRIFSGVSPPRECIVVCEYSPHLPSTIPSLNVDREGARPALVLACPASEYSAHLSPSTQFCPREMPK
uniref:SFRICE_027721 n=1 Tax=Spodoptera frugiperda TaxID=7108 RepID=A0A2H1VC27_SPOFR